MSNRLKIASLVLLGVMAVAGLTASFLWHRRAGVAELSTGVALAPSRELPDFNLIDHRGQPFGKAQLTGHWSLMFFGYTNCPDFCPTTLATLAALAKRLRAEHAPQLPQVLFMSVDARRDTPEQLARYVPYFDSSFLGLTARDQPAIEALAQKLNVAVIVHPESNGGYSVDHSGAIFVIDPAGRLAAILTGPFTPEALAGDLERLTAARA